jgi:hypothetical protein
LKQGFEAVDLSRIKTIALSERPSLASSMRQAGIPPSTGAVRFFDSLPHFLKADDLRSLIGDILRARSKGKPVVVMAGGHVIKVGLNPIIIDLMKRGLITGLCLNGAGLIHDSEMALIGQTSEDVAEGLADGSFGMAAETAQIYNVIVAFAAEHGIGLGQAAGAVLNRQTAKNSDISLLAACNRLGLPAMIHIAVDTDIVCQHPGYDPAAAAAASHVDFKILARILSEAESGGVFINIGSAVILPEVFLKALTVARNIYKKPYRIVTANFDMINHYRPAANVVHRPTMYGGTGYNFIGHHELMIPLLAWGLKAFDKHNRKYRNQ